MSDLETRLREELDSRVDTGDTELWLRSVRRRSALRRGMRAASIVAGVVVVLVGGAVLVQGWHGQQTPPRPVTSPSGTASAPAGVEQPGVVGLSAAGDRVFRLTYDIGCRECDSVWLHQPSGGWQRLYDFEGLAAYGGSTVGMKIFGPIDSFAMASNGVDGWAWGQRFWATHDGGHTWTVVRAGPGKHTLYGRRVVASGRYAWAERATLHGGTLWRSRVGSDSWQQVAGAPGTNEEWHIVGVLPGGGVALAAYRTDGTHQMLVLGRPGSWSRLPVPFSDHATILQGGSQFWLESGGQKSQLYRLAGRSFVRVATPPGQYIVPLDEHRALLLDHRPVLVLDDNGDARATDLPAGISPGSVHRAGDGTFWLLASNGETFSSANGTHWTNQQ